MAATIPGIRVRLLTSDPKSLPQITPEMNFVAHGCTMLNLQRVVRKRVVEAITTSGAKFTPLKPSDAIFIMSETLACPLANTTVGEIAASQPSATGYTLFWYRRESVYG